MATGGQLRGDHVIRNSVRAQLDNHALHLRSTGQIRQGPHPDRQLPRRCCASFPHDPHVHLVAPLLVEHDFVDQAAQHGLLLGLRQDVVLPQLRQLLPDVRKGRLQLGRKRRQRNWLLHLADIVGFRLRDLDQRGLPALLQFRRHQAVVRVDPTELPFGQARCVAQALKMLTPCLRKLGVPLLLAATAWA